jgi:hypothetical protein
MNGLFRTPISGTAEGIMHTRVMRAMTRFSSASSFLRSFSVSIFIFRYYLFLFSLSLYFFLKCLDLKTYRFTKGLDFQKCSDVKQLTF